VCKDGLPCEGGQCAGAVCCEAVRACGAECCAEGKVCSFTGCVEPGGPCLDEDDCPAQHYCDLSLGTPGGAGGSGGPAGAGGGCFSSSQPDGRCLPLPPVCSDGAAGAAGAGGEACLGKCEYKPDAPDFATVLKFSWGGQITEPFATDVMMTPIVIQLDDDDCDGAVTARDVPEIVFTSFHDGKYDQAGTLHSISIVDGAFVEKWSVPGVVDPSRQLAAGNIDGVPGNEIVACGADGAVYAFGADGALRWKTPGPVGCRMPSLADLDQDGKPEVIVEGGILDGVDGSTKHTYADAVGNELAVSDVDGDGKLDVVSARRAFRGNGTLLCDSGLDGNWPAVADLDNDGVPEIVGVDYWAHQLRIWHVDPSKPGGFAVVRAGIDVNGVLDPSLCADFFNGNKHGGGPVTIGDFDHDGHPDVALAGGVGYAVFDGKKLTDPAVADADTFLWVKQTQDCSSASTGSSLFDFNGDGKNEVLYADERYLRIYEGATGAVLFETCNTDSTLNENPVVADVDNDGQADIVVASNGVASLCDGTKQAGIRVFGSASGSWVRTRRVWNQHAYHVTNVGEDGSIPQVEQPHWKTPALNAFRTNKQAGNEFAAPDATVTVHPACGQGDFVAAVVRNLGQAPLTPGVSVTFYKGAPDPGHVIGSGVTTLTLHPGQAEWVLLETTDAEIKQSKAKVSASVEVLPPSHECRTDNNTAPEVFGSCWKP
jgi:hypothetical protein